LAHLSNLPLLRLTRRKTGEKVTQEQEHTESPQAEPIQKASKFWAFLDPDNRAYNICNIALGTVKFNAQHKGL
jgi:hypothetical protein